MPSINGVGNLGNGVLLTIGTSTAITAASFADSTGDLRTSLNGKQDTLSAQQLADIAEVSNKQDTLTGTGDVPGLDAALAAKQASLTGTSDVPGLDSALGAKQTTLTDTSDVPGLDSALGAKQTTLTGTSDGPGLDTALGAKQSTLTSTSDVPGLDTTLGAKQGTLTGTSDVPGLDTALGAKQGTLTGTSDVPGLDTALGAKQGTLTGTSDVPGLDTALGAKQAALTNTSDVPGLDTALGAKQATLTDTSDVPGLDTALGAKQATITTASQVQMLRLGLNTAPHGSYLLNVNGTGLFNSVRDGTGDLRAAIASKLDVSDFQRHITIIDNSNDNSANTNFWGSTNPASNASYVDKMGSSNGQQHLGDTLVSESGGILTMQSAGAYRIQCDITASYRDSPQPGHRVTMAFFVSKNDSSATRLLIPPVTGSHAGTLYIRDEDDGIAGSCSFVEYFDLAVGDTIRVKVLLDDNDANSNVPPLTWDDREPEANIQVLSRLEIERVSTGSLQSGL